MPPVSVQFLAQDGDHNSSESTTLLTEVVDKKVNGPYPNPTVTHPANPVSVTSSDLQPPDIQPQVPMYESTVPQALTFS